MAYLEAMVVIYLRMILPMAEWNRLTSPASVASFLQKYHVLWTEQTREAATIIMLLAVAIISGLNARQKIAYFLWTFGVWDIFYYVSLYALIKWPPGLATMDLLFLIPGPWIAPVYLPVMISAGMLVLAVVILWLETGGGKKPSGSKKGKS
jgi:hypothetical protein